MYTEIAVGELRVKKNWYSSVTWKKAALLTTSTRAQRLHAEIAHRGEGYS